MLSWRPRGAAIVDDPRDERPMCQGAHRNRACRLETVSVEVLGCRASRRDMSAGYSKSYRALALGAARISAPGSSRAPTRFDRRTARPRNFDSRGRYSRRRTACPPGWLVDCSTYLQSQGAATGPRPARRAKPRPRARARLNRVSATCLLQRLCNEKSPNSNVRNLRRQGIRRPR